MAITLFRATEKNQLYKELEKNISIQYQWEKGLEWINFDDKFILVNPQNGSWIVFDEFEYSDIVKNNYPLEGLTGSFFYNLGICTKNGNHKPFDTKSTYTENLYFFEFATTTNCNFKCKYCFAESAAERSHKKANNVLAELFIDRVAEYRANTKTTLPFIIEFTGGEPLLNFPIIRYTFEYAKARYGDLLNAEFVIQSNISLLNDEIIQYCRSNKIGIGISCDGFESIHNLNRPLANGNGSFKKVYDNIIKLQQKYPENNGAVITVITEESVEMLSEIILYLYLLGFREISLRPMAVLGRALKKFQKKPFSKQYVKNLFSVLTDVISPIFYEKHEIICEHFLARTFQHLLHPYHSFMCERSPCGGARNICITMPNGDVYPCNQSTDSKHMLLGNLYDSKFVELLKSESSINLQKRIVNNIDECKNCIYRIWCGSPCPIEALYQNGDIMSKSAECDIFKERYNMALKGLVNNSFDLEIISRLVGSKDSIKWLDLKHMKGGDDYARTSRRI